MAGEEDVRRCRWVAGGSDLDVAYHDLEWGVPVHDEHRLFEFLQMPEPEIPLFDELFPRVDDLLPRAGYLV